MAGTNDLFPGPGGMNPLSPWGDPEAYTAAAASTAMEPIIGPYLKNIFTGENIAHSLEMFAPTEAQKAPFDPNKPLSAYMSEESLNQAMNIGLSFGPGAIAGVRGASMAASPKLATLDHAQAMERGDFPYMRQHTPDEIFDATGWFRGLPSGEYAGAKPGQWMWNLSDAGASLNKDNLLSFDVGGSPGGGPETHYAVPFGKDLKLPDVFNHPDLYAAYPHLKDVKVQPIPSWAEGYVGGHIDPATNTIAIRNMPERDFGGVIAHEVEHLIALHEGHPEGGNVQQFLPPFHAENTQLAEASRQITEQEIRDAGFDPLHVQWAHGLHPSVERFSAYDPFVKGLPDHLLRDYKDVTKWQSELDSQAREAGEKYRGLHGEMHARAAEAQYQVGRWDLPPWRLGEWRGEAGGGGSLFPYPNVMLDRTTGAYVRGPSETLGGGQ